MFCRRAILWILALAPILAHFAAFTLSVIRQGYVIFGRTDLVVLSLSVAYLLVLLALFGNPRRTGRYLLASYSLLFALLVAEWLVPPFVIPTPLVANYPWPPMQYIRKAAKEVSPNRDQITFSVNRFGVRGREVDPASADISVLCVGGSTTECLYNTDEDSWPWQVENTLQSKSTRNVFVGNAGRSGHIAANHAFLIRNYDGTERFQWVLVMCGVNDVGALLRREREKRLAVVQDETLYVWNRPHEAYYRRFGLWRVMETVLDVGTPLARGQVFQDATGDWYEDARRRRRDALAKRTFTEPPNDLPAALADYRQDLISIIQAAKERGRRIAMMTQPTLWRADLPPDLAAKLWEHTDVGAYTPAVLAQVMDSFNQVMIEVCAEKQVPCFDLASKIPKDASVFYDDCHFHDPGCKIVAVIVAQWARKNRILE